MHASVVTFAHDSDNRHLIGWGLAVFIPALLLVLVMLPPFVPEAAQLAIMKSFSLVCHQLQNRSFQMDGIALDTCHRCTGIYGGLLLAAMVFPLTSRKDALLWKHSRLLILGSLIPMGVDWGGGLLGIWENGPATRVITGVVFGVVAGYFLARALFQLCTWREHKEINRAA